MQSFDELWPAGPRFARADAGFKLGTDSVLLAYFTNTARAKSCCDLGAGTGVLSILLCEKAPGLILDAMEIQPDWAALCRQNLKVNGYDARANVITGDIRAHRELLTAGSYDLVVSNPPYFPEHSGKTAPDESRAQARDERSCTLQDICQAAAYLCRWGGSFSLVHRAERLSEVFCAMTAVGIEPKRLRTIQHKANAAPNLVLIEGRRGGRPGLAMEAPLILCQPDGSDSPEAAALYHS